MAARTPVDRYLEAMSETNEALIDSIRAGNERAYRISNVLLSEWQRGQREQFELGRHFAENPRDVRGFFDEWMDVASRARARNAEVAREIIDELAQGASDVRTAAQKAFRAGRGATEAAAEGARETVAATAETARGVAARATRTAAAAAGDVAENVAEAAGETEEAAQDAASRSRRAVARANGADG